MKLPLLYAACTFAITLFPGTYYAPSSTYGTDKTAITRVHVHSIVRPTSLEELRRIVCTARHPISIGGSFFSQGGQTAYPGGIVIDMSCFKGIRNLNRQRKLITVQAGATWKQVQEAIDPHNLSVKVMQSYNDFSVGGSLSVNVHARDKNYGTIADTVESFRMMLHDGTIVDVDRSSELFYGAIGGYGLLGIIIDVTLSLTDNVALARSVKSISAAEYPQVFEKLKLDGSVVFQNADLYPPDLTHGTSITWRTTEKQLTTDARLQSFSLGHAPQRAFEKVMQKVPEATKIRPKLDTLRMLGSPVVWRNYEMSYGTNQLAIQNHFPTTMTLQEYFVPVARYDEALQALRSVFKLYEVHILNVSVRYVPKDTGSMLAYASEDSYAVVLYICLPNSDKGKKMMTIWTQVLINKILSLGGTYYLPYMMAATTAQFRRAYKRSEEFAQLKAHYDPKGIFKNMLWKKYFEI